MLYSVSEPDVDTIGGRLQCISIAIWVLKSELGLNLDVYDRSESVIRLTMVHAIL